jgi:hypothetical protein
MDEAFLTIHGARHYLWRAVDQDGTVLDILGQRRDKKAAKKFFRLPNIFASDGICSLRPYIVKRCGKDSPSGRKSRSSQSPLKTCDRGSRAFFGPIDMLLGTS